MQFSTVLTTLVSLAATGASAAAIKARQNGTDPVGAVGLYNNDNCELEAHEVFLLGDVGDCISFEQGYGSAYLSPTNSLGEHFRKSQYLKEMVMLHTLPFSYPPLKTRLLSIRKKADPVVFPVA